MKEKNLTIKGLILLVGLLVTSCTTGMTLTVLDSETKQPIEGASCLAWWNVKELSGSYYVAKIVEAKTDGKGKFRVPMVLGLKALRDPNIKIYKPGYVGWYDSYIYKGYRVDEPSLPKQVGRNDFKYKSQNIFMEKYDENNEKYSHNTHYRFLEQFLPSMGDMSELRLRHLLFYEDIGIELQYPK